MNDISEIDALQELADEVGRYMGLTLEIDGGYVDDTYLIIVDGVPLAVNGVDIHVDANTMNLLLSAFNAIIYCSAEADRAEYEQREYDDDPGPDFGPPGSGAVITEYAVGTYDEPF